MSNPAAGSGPTLLVGYSTMDHLEYAACAVEKGPLPPTVLGRCRGNPAEFCQLTAMTAGVAGLMTVGGRSRLLLLVALWAIFGIGAPPLGAVELAQYQPVPQYPYPQYQPVPQYQAAPLYWPGPPPVQNPAPPVSSGGVQVPRAPVYEPGPYDDYNHGPGGY